MTESRKTSAALSGKASPAPEGRGLFSGRNRPLCIAHRGFSAQYPENTMPAFRAAADAGADMIELDVTLTSDREVVVIHDDTLDRTTDGSGPVAEAPLAAIQSQDAGSWFAPEFAGVRVPALSQVLSALQNRILLNVELKSQGSPDADELLARYVAALVREHRMEGSVLFSSFSDRATAGLRKALPGAYLGVLSTAQESPESALSRVAASRAVSFHPNAVHLNPRLVSALHAAGVRVLVWAYAADNRPGIMERALASGADGFFANDPELFLAVREKVCAKNLP